MHKINNQIYLKPLPHVAIDILEPLPHLAIDILKPLPHLAIDILEPLPHLAIDILDDVFDLSDNREFIEPELHITENMEQKEIDKINIYNSQRLQSISLFEDLLDIEDKKKDLMKALYNIKSPNKQNSSHIGDSVKGGKKISDKLYNKAINKRKKNIN